MHAVEVNKVLEEPELSHRTTEDWEQENIPLPFVEFEPAGRQ